MKAVVVLVTLFTVLAGAPAAHAEDGPEGDGTGGAFSPKFDNSPVTLVLCLTKDACKFRGPKA